MIIKRFRKYPAKKNRKTGQDRSKPQHRLEQQTQLQQTSTAHSHDHNKAPSKHIILLQKLSATLTRSRQARIQQHSRHPFGNSNLRSITKLIPKQGRKSFRFLSIRPRTSPLQISLIRSRQQLSDFEGILAKLP